MIEATHSNSRSSAAPPSPAELSLCLDAVHAAVAVLSTDNSIAWANRRWTQQLGAWFAASGGAGRHDRAREAEQESLLAQVRKNGRAVSFRDVVEGHAMDATVMPLEGGRLMVVLDPVGVGSDESRSGPQGVERIELKHTSHGPLDRLSRREREVLLLLASGLTIKRIAEKLARSEKTIEGHRDSIYRKVGVNSRAEIAILAMRAGMMAGDAAAPHETGASTNAHR